MIDQEIDFKNMEKLGSKHIDNLVQAVATSESAARLQRLLERADQITKSRESKGRSKAA